jgi:hypothetical protein
MDENYIGEGTRGFECKGKLKVICDKGKRELIVCLGNTR